MLYKKTSGTLLLSREEEADLIELTRSGDGSAFNRLVRVFNKVLVGHMLRSFWWMQLSDAEDIAQETWKEVLVKIGKKGEDGGYSYEKGRFFTWIKNYILDFKVKQYAAYKKKHATAQPFDSDEDEDWICRLPDPDQTFIPDINLEIREEQQIESERLKRIHLAYMELLRILFLCGGYPHQQLAYAFSKLLFGRESDRGTEGSPQRLNSEYGDIPFARLSDLFWKTYSTLSNIPMDILTGNRNVLEPLIYRLDCTVATLFYLDNASKVQFSHMEEKHVGETSLSDYWEKHKNGFTSAVPDWCYKVKVRIQKILGVERSVSETDMLKNLIFRPEGRECIAPECNRCKIRHLPPCNND